MSASPLTELSPEAASARRDHDVEELREALATGQLVLHYQPKVDAASGKLRGLESLVRWNHPTRGLVPPLEFIPLAEESGLIGALGEWVLTEACRQQAEWAAALGPAAPPVVCVNVSGRQLVPGFADLVRRTVVETGVVPESLCLEITETAVMDDVDAAIALIAEVKTLGLLIAIDDFGTGLSSLSHLQRFPIDELKIDKSFVDQLAGDSADGTIVAAIIAMGHALGLLMIAEGVETTSQLQQLQHLGCDMVQGFLFSRPLPAADIASLGSVLDPTDAGNAPASLARAPELVLIIDDTADVRRLAKVSLATSGFEVIEASSGREALAQARRSRPIGVVLDVDMPDMDGFEVCRALRGDPLTESVAILMLTSLADAADKIQAFSAGADDYMLKPFAPRELVSRMRQALARRADSA